MSWVSPDESPDGLAASLATRAPLLQALAESPRDKGALRKELDVARSTVYKGLRELTEQGLARETDNGYTLTATGQLARELHDSYRERLEQLADARPVLASVPAEAGVPVAFLEDATVATARRHAPERPLTVFESAFDGSDNVRSLSPAAVPRFMPDLHEAVEDGDHRSLVVERAAAEALAERYDRFNEALAAGLEVYVVDRSLPFGLTVADDGAALTTYDEGGVSGLVYSSADEAIGWAQETFEQYREQGEQL